MFERFHGEGIIRLGLLWWPGSRRAGRAKLSVNRDKLQAIFGFQPPADGVVVAILPADLKIRPESPNFPLFRQYLFQLERQA